MKHTNMMISSCIIYVNYCTSLYYTSQDIFNSDYEKMYTTIVSIECYTEERKRKTGETVFIGKRIGLSVGWSRRCMRWQIGTDTNILEQCKK